MDTSTRLKGHGLQAGGKAFEWDAQAGEPRRVNSDTPWPTDLSHIGFALCECGARSAEFHSNAARKRWHREVHKPEVRARMGGSYG